MTAFDNTQPEHTYEVDEGEGPASDVPQPSFPCSYLLSAQKKLCSCKPSCNQEACSSVQRKEISLGCSVVCCLCSERLSGVLMPNQEVLCFFKRELEQERIAAESAANEAISMILRLQVEKAALQMEARHYQQALEAKTLYDEETIYQLQATISSQEAERLALEKEIDEFREALQKYSDIVADKGCSGFEEFGKGCMMASTAPTFAKKRIRRMPLRGNGGGRRPLSLEEKFNHVALQTREDAQQLDWPSLVDSKDEAKTKYVVSMSTSDPTLLVNPGNCTLKARTMTPGAYLSMQDCQNETLELESVKVDVQGKCLDVVVKDCWLSLLLQFSELYKNILKIEALGHSSYEEDCRLAQYQESIVNSRSQRSEMHQKFSVAYAKDASWDDCALDAFRKEDYIFPPNLARQNLECKIDISNNCKLFHQQEKVGNAQVCAPKSSWCELMAKMDGYILNLAKKFATCQSRFHTLEATRITMTDAIKMMKENKWKADSVLMIAADMIRDFVGFVGLGLDTLDLMHNLMAHLTIVVNDVECAENDSSVNFNSSAMKPDDTLTKDQERIRSLIPHNSDFPPEMDCKMDKLTCWWSSSFEWLSDQKCRAETAFSGWDHI